MDTGWVFISLEIVFSRGFSRGREGVYKGGRFFSFVNKCLRSKERVWEISLVFGRGFGGVFWWFVYIFFSKD